MGTIAACNDWTKAVTRICEEAPRPRVVDTTIDVGVNAESHIENITADSTVAAPPMHDGAYPSGLVISTDWGK